MRAIGFASNVSLEAWLFGEDAQDPRQAQGRALPQQQQPPQAPQRAETGVQSSSARRNGSGSRGGSRSASPAPIGGGVARSNSLPVNSVTQRAAPMRPKKMSLAPSVGTTHVELFPVSSKLRKLFRPNRVPWNRARQSISGMTPEDKQRQLLGLSTASFQRLQGHVPFTLKEIVKDPKKLPYLLRWLSADDQETPSSQTNYHQVLLFLLEIEQLQLVTEEKRKEQAWKIWNKYIDNASEFQISTTLELTKELEALVRESIDCSEKVLDSFFPIQKLAYMRLTREEMPRFLKSPEYLQMLIDTENDTESVPMERILQQPRAAHYFLLFLMQSRQHFELYFWLHVEYVLKPLLDREDLDLFWKLAKVLVKKAHNDSQAISLATKSDLQQALETRRLDNKQVNPQPIARALFLRAQQEIFVMLRSSWYDRFMKSNLYKVALKDSRILLDKSESKEDSPPKLMARTFSSLEYAALRLNHEDNPVATAHLDRMSGPLVRHEQTVMVNGSDETNSSGISEESSESESDSQAEETEDSEFSNIVLDLESIIRLTKLPDGLQVHYRPHYEAPANNLSDNSEIADSGIVDSIFTFATFVEKQIGADVKSTLMLMPVKNPNEPFSAKSCDDIANRVKAFVVPDGRTVIRQFGSTGPPDDIIFPFQQSGRNGFLYGCVYLTYELVHVGSEPEALYVARGLCITSRFTLVQSLRDVMERYVVGVLQSMDRFDPDRLVSLFSQDMTIKDLKFVSRMPAELIKNRSRSESSILNICRAVDARVDVSVRPLFDLFGPAVALQILACALLECSIVFVSKHYSLLTTCAEAVRCLLRPFAWCHVYAPVLPKTLLSYLQCPTPIIVGLHSSYADREDLPSTGFYAVADMDRRTLEFVGQQTVGWRQLGLRDTRQDRIYLPRSFEVMKDRLDQIFPVSHACGDRVTKHMPATDTISSTLGEEERIRLLCFELFSSLLDGHTEACLVVGDTKESVVIFDESQFLSARPSEDYTFFYSLLRTQCFSEIVSSHRIDAMTSAADVTSPRNGGKKNCTVELV